MSFGIREAEQPEQVSPDYLFKAIENQLFMTKKKKNGMSIIKLAEIGYIQL